MLKKFFSSSYILKVLMDDGQTYMCIIGARKNEEILVTLTLFSGS